MTNLTSRILSAIAALLILTTVIYFFKQDGLYGLVIFASLRGAYELSRMMFKNKYDKFSHNYFIFISFLTFILLTQLKTYTIDSVILLISFVSFVVFAILRHKHFQDLNGILDYVTKSTFGMIYTAAIPACVAWLIYSPQGMTWFYCLLTVIFAGDIGAYVFGVTMGKNKIAPALSPQKSLQGAFGGLLFSTIAALVFAQFLPTTPHIVLALCGLLGGAIGQIGDFFESLIKRISGVKDSGSIMPGHGGILDRLDGVLMAAPLFYLVAMIFGM